MKHNRIGLGTFPLANVFSEIKKDTAIKIVETFVNNGGYYIDAAPMYGFGEIEKLLGQTLKKYPREKYYMITKCGYIDVEGKTFQTLQKSGKYKDVIRECEISIKRLNSDYIDLYFLHSPDPKTPITESMEAMLKLQKDGKVKEIGLSNVNLTELKECMAVGRVDYIQNRFSLINRSIDKNFADYLVKNNIKLVPYQPIDRGQLSNRALKPIILRDGDLRKPRSDWQPEQMQAVTSWVKEKLYPLAQKLNIPIEHLALAWALHQPYMGFVIVGATNIEQVKNNLKADQLKISPEILRQIDQAYLELEKYIQEKYHQSIREFRGLNEKFY